MKKILIALTLIYSAYSAFIIAFAATPEESLFVTAMIALVLLIGLLIISRNHQPGMLTLNCGTLTAGIALSCSNLPVAGTEVIIYLANRSEIASVSHDVTNPLIVDGITMVTGKKFFKFEGLKLSNDLKTEMHVGTFKNDWIHGGDIIVFMNDPTTKKTVEQLSLANIVAIVENKKKGSTGNEAFEMHGEIVGLEASAITRRANDGDTQGGWKCTLTSPKDQFEPHVPNSLFDTDYTTTKAFIEALTV